MRTGLMAAGRRPRLMLGLTGILGLVLTGAITRTALAQAPLQVLEPAKAEPAVARTPDRSRWSWNQSQAQITATGDLAWQPQAFKFEAGPSIRYIDFDGGDDASPGTTKEKPWKHHPWDAAAAGKAKACTGIQTYVFKRGVVYRGSLRPAGAVAGTQADLVRLSSDPSWGEGEAVIAGSERISQWTKGARRADIPNAAAVWWVDLPFAPRNVWEVRADGIERIALARTPNWKASNREDVMSEWWSWEQPEWWTNKHHIEFQGHKAHRGIDTQHLTQPAEYYVGAILRTEFSIVMGTPFPTRVEGYDATKKALIFQGIWFGDTEQISTGNRYYLEDKPQYLDVPGEFWFDKKAEGEGGRLYVRLAADRDPNQADVEVARQMNLLEAESLRHVAISGLTFRFTNTYWDLTQPGWGHKDVSNAAVRVLGTAEDVRITNCRFEDVAKAVRIDAGGKGANMGRLVIADNDMQRIDHGAVDVIAGGHGDVRILRNRLQMIGVRPNRQDWGHALVVSFPVTMEVAGNMLERCYGAGIFLYGGKQSGDLGDVPLSRVLVHGNRAVDTLLAANDWGGIETWQGGPHYIYDNISGNANGYWNWAKGRLGYTYYLDGSFKNYMFNNVAWGLTPDPKSMLCAAAAINEAVPTVENTVFNNTFHNFAKGSCWSPAGGRHLELGNIWSNIATMVFQHGQLKEDKGPTPAAYQHFSAGLGRNIFCGVQPSKQVAVFEASGASYDDVKSLSEAMTAQHSLAGDVGERSTKPVMRDLDRHDFRLVSGSAAVDHGVSVFVPWSVARCVGEWQFRRNNADPTVLLDNHWYLTTYYALRENYYLAPTNPLKAVNVTAGDYVQGPLEDWTASALRFNGTNQYAVLKQADMTKPYRYDAQVDGRMVQRTAQGAELATPDIGATNVLIEAYFQTKAGHSGSVLVSKMNGQAGYQLAVNQAGGVTLTLLAGGQKAELASGAQINDGKWHHVLAEVDRKANNGTIYVDGRATAQGSMSLPAGSSLANNADLLVGKGAEGHFFAGAIDFLRIARSTLPESRTSIEELYDWEFDGPFLRDFAGHEVNGKARDAGAFELEQ